MNRPTAVIFDLGNVCIDWSPFRFFIKHGYSKAEAQALVDGPVSLEWHSRCDCGLPMAENVRQRIAEYPEHEAALSLYLERWQETIPGSIEGTVGAIAALDAANIPLYALTNFPGDMYGAHYDRFAFMKRFRDVVVSGEVGLKKPDPRIYALAIDRFDVDPRRTLFIDDRIDNCQAAGALGFQWHQFQSSGALLADLEGRGLL